MNICKEKNNVTKQHHVLDNASISRPIVFIDFIASTMYKYICVH
jgi:hypothetical protein